MNLLNLAKNAPEYSVSQITSAIRDVIYNNFSAIKIRGEICGLKVSTRGHVYFSLKDSASTINAVCFAGNFKSIKINLTDGVEILAYGSIDTFGSGYQLKVETAEYAGIGALMKLMEERKQKLEKKGFFKAEYKKSIPPSFCIENVGIITSPTGAVIQDIINRMSERYPKNILLFGTAVQGLEASSQIIAGINYFNNISSVVPEVIIIARGGGSVEDLFCFNDEEVAIAVFNSKIPIISAIGHEIDTTIIDYVSDLRAATPTAAAEIVTTPTLKDINESIALNYQIIYNNGKRQIAKHYEKLAFLKHRVNNTKNKIIFIFQNFTALKSRFSNLFKVQTFKFNEIKNRLMKNLFISKNLIYKKLDILTLKLKKSDKTITFFAQNILNKIHTLKNKLEISIWHKYNFFNNKKSKYKDNLLQKIPIKIQKIDTKYNSLKQSVSYLDFAKNLKKGYAIILDKNNKITKTTLQLKKLHYLKVKMHDGLVEIEK